MSASILQFVKRQRFVFLRLYSQRSRYSEADETLILHTLNTSDAKVLTRLTSTKALGKYIINHRNTNEEFSSLTQLMEISGFEEKCVQTLYQNIIHNALETKEKNVKPSRKLIQLINPTLTPQRISEINSVVGISLGPFSSSWTGVYTKDHSIFDWQFYEYQLNPDAKKHTEIQLLDAAYELHSKIPLSDVYVLDGHFKGPQQQAANNAAAQQRLQLLSMLSVLLNDPRPPSSGPDTWQHKVLFQKPYLWCRLFGTMIGSEKVSPQTFVQDMLQGKEMGNFYTPLNIAPEWRKVYLSHNGAERESLCSALLLTISFLDLNIIKNINSFNLIQGRSRKKNS